MAEEQQVMKEPQQELQRVTKKNQKKVEVGRCLAVNNHRKRKEKKAQNSEVQTMEQGASTSELNQYYGIGAVIAVGVIDGLGYYIYQVKKGEVPPQTQPNNPPKPCHQTNKFEMD